MAVLGRRLGRGLLANLQRLEEKPLAGLSWKKVDFEFPLNPRITSERMMEELAREGAVRTDLLRAARNLAIVQNWSDWRRCAVYRLSLGPEVDLLSLPGEVCVEYQLYAQSQVPEKFLACAACGNATYAYIPTARMYEEGGYEPNSSIGTPAVEERLKQAIAELLDFRGELGR